MNSICKRKYWSVYVPYTNVCCELDYNIIRKEALETWKQRKGNAATYAELIKVFEAAGYRGYADSVRKISTESGQCT